MKIFWAFDTIVLSIFIQGSVFSSDLTSFPTNQGVESKLLSPTASPNPRPSPKSIAHSVMSNKSSLYSTLTPNGTPATNTSVVSFVDYKRSSVLRIDKAGKEEAYYSESESKSGRSESPDEDNTASESEMDDENDCIFGKGDDSPDNVLGPRFTEAPPSPVSTSQTPPPPSVPIPNSEFPFKPLAYPSSQFSPLGLSSSGAGICAFQESFQNGAGTVYPDKTKSAPILGSWTDDDGFCPLSKKEEGTITELTQLLDSDSKAGSPIFESNSKDERQKESSLKKFIRKILSICPFSCLKKPENDDQILPTDED